MKKKYIVASMAIGFSILGVFSVVYAQSKSILESNVGELVSYPRNPHAQMYESYENLSLGFDISSLKNIANVEILDISLSNGAKNVLGFANPEGSEFKYKFIIFPIITDAQEPSLLSLENFILSKVGILSKYDQKITTLNNGREIVQIGYKFESHEVHFDLYTLIKEWNRGLVIYTPYSNESDYKESLIVADKGDSEMVGMINTFRFLKKYNLKTFNFLDLPSFHTIQEYKDNNKHFETNF